VGGGNLPPDPVFSRLHQNCLEFCGTLPWLFLDIYWLQNPKKNFCYICYRPPNFGGKQRAPQMTKNWFRAKLVLGVPQMEKSDGYIHVFMRRQADDTSADFSWRHMQTGSRNPPKPEVVITKRREDISTWSQRLQHSFRARPIHFHLRRPRPTMENTVRCKPEVVKVSETGSTINLATETGIDAISVSIPMFWKQDFHWCTCQSHPMLSSPRNPRWPTDTGSSYNFATKNDIIVISTATT